MISAKIQHLLQFAGFVFFYTQQVIVHFKTGKSILWHPPTLGTVASQSLESSEHYSTFMVAKK